MKWPGVVGVLVIVAGLWLVLDIYQRPLETGDQGVAGIEFVIPGDYRVLDLGESTPAVAALALLETAEAGDKVAAVFTHMGDRVQLLVDMTQDTIDERVAGRHGTVRRVLWRESVHERLRWAGDHGEFNAPGLPPPERRNPYH